MNTFHLPNSVIHSMSKIIAIAHGYSHDEIDETLMFGDIHNLTDRRVYLRHPTHI